MTEGEDGVQEKRHEEKIEDITLLSDTSEGGGRGDKGGTEAEERPCMCMHTTNKTDRHIFFLCLVCDQLLLEGFSRQKDLLHLKASGYRT